MGKQELTTKSDKQKKSQVLQGRSTQRRPESGDLKLEDCSKQIGSESSPESLLSVLTSPEFSHPVNATQKVNMISHLHQTYGNRHVQRVIQAKLKIGQPNDKYEKEADRVAHEVMRMPEPQVQRPLAKAENEVSETKEAPSQSSETITDLQSGINAIRASGRPLPKSIRAFFEPRFGRDLSRVRLHSNPEAAKMARALNARAFTVGRDIIFGSGQFAPGTTSGQMLLAHELTHVVHQSDEISIQNNGKVSVSYCEVPSLQRWVASEHVYVGEQVYTPKKIREIFENTYSKPHGDKSPLRNYPEGLTFGQIAAMADLYGAFEKTDEEQEKILQDLYDAPRKEIINLLEAIKEEEKIVIKKEESSKGLIDIDKKYREITGGRYLELAKENYSHFSGKAPDKFTDPYNNTGVWETLHERAIAIAKSESNTKTNPEMAARAIAQNAYADHYLMDAFAIGHLTARLEGMEDTRQAIEGMIEEVLNDVLTDIIKESSLTSASSVILSVFSWKISLFLHLAWEHYLKKNLGSWVLNHILNDEQREQIKKVKFKVIHDLDNEYGRIVTNKLGSTPWAAFGDEHLLDTKNSMNLKWMILGVKDSLLDIESALSGFLHDSWGALDIVPIKTEKGGQWTLDDARKRLWEIFKDYISLLEYIILTDDDEIRDYLRNVTADEIRLIPWKEKSRIIGVLFSGACRKEDEQAILNIIDFTTQPEIVKIVQEQDLREFLYRFDGEEFETLVLTLHRRGVYSALSYPQLRDGILQLSIFITTGLQEKAIITILQSLYFHGQEDKVRRIIRFIGVDQLYSDLTGSSQEQFEFLLGQLGMKRKE